MLVSNFSPCCHISLPYITAFDIEIICQRIHTTCSHTSCCHYCQYFTVTFVLFQNVTCYIDSLLSCIHVNTTYLLNIMCTLVATCMILGRLEYTNLESKNKIHGRGILNPQFMEGGDYRIQAYLPSIQHNNLTPCKFDLFQMTWSRLICGP